MEGFERSSDVLYEEKNSIIFVEAEQSTMKSSPTSSQDVRHITFSAPCPAHVSFYFEKLPATLGWTGLVHFGQKELNWTGLVKRNSVKIVPETEIVPFQENK